MESSIREYMNEMKKYIKYWEEYRNSSCVTLPEGVLRDTMVNTANEIIQERQEDLKELILDMEDLNIGLE